MGHRPSTRKQVADLLYDDFEPFSVSLPGKLLSVSANEDASLLITNLDSGGLHFRANADDDTLVWNDGPREELSVDLSNSDPWRELIGVECDFAWSTTNQQGYIDGALLSFGGMLPKILLNVAASSIRVSSCGIWMPLVRS